MGIYLKAWVKMAIFVFATLMATLFGARDAHAAKPQYVAPGANVNSASLAQVQTNTDSVQSEPERHGWTAWSSRVYDAARDNGDFWLAQDGGLTRWNPDDGIVEQITQIDGLPHTSVYSVVVDEDEVLWLSGDAGVSMRDAAGRWFHCEAELPPIAQGQSLALGNGGEVWVGHGREEVSQVSQRTASGEWITYASVKETVEADFAAVLASVNRQTLWNVSYGEVWVGFEAYDGSVWNDRTPAWSDPRYTEQYGVIADDAGNVYTMPVYGEIKKWDGTIWQTTATYESVRDRGFFVAPNGTPWLFAETFSLPGRPRSYEVINLMTEGGTSVFAPFLTFAAAEDEQLWLFDPTMITRVSADDATDSSVYYLSEYLLSPRVQSTEDSVVFMSGRKFLMEPRQLWSDTIRSFDTAGTATVVDDQWIVVRESPDLAAWGISLDRSVWSLTNDISPAPYTECASPPLHQIGEVDVTYPAWPDGVEYVCIRRMSIVDPQTVLFTGDWKGKQILRLHNGGTPEDFGDDQWAVYDTPAAADAFEDAFGRLWVSESFYNPDSEMRHWETFRRDEESGQWSDPIVSSPEMAEFEEYQLVPAGDGFMLFVPQFDRNISVIWPDDTVEEVSISELATEYLSLLRTTKRLNARWAIGPDDALWYVRFNADTGARELVKHAETGTIVYPMPSSIDRFTEVAIDRYGHIWLADRGYTIWRFSELPDFSLSAQPTHLLMTPASAATGVLSIAANSEFSGTIDIEATNLPEEVDVEFGEDTVAASESVPFTVTVGPEAKGNYQVQLTARSNALVRFVTLQIDVADQVHEVYLPVIN